MNFVLKIGMMSMREAAMRWGTRIGLEMILAFGFYLGGVYDSSIWTLFFWALLLYIPCHAIFYMFLWRFVVNRGDKHIFNMLGFGLSLFIYAILLTSVAYFVYFQFIDHGFLVQNIMTVITEPESRALLEQMVSVQQVAQMEAAMDGVMALTPIQVTVQLMMINYMMCIPIVVIGALIICIMPEPRFIKILHTYVDQRMKDGSDHIEEK